MNEELFTVVHNQQLHGEYLRWGTPTGDFDYVPKGKYYRDGYTLTLALKQPDGSYTRSNKHAYRVTEGLD